MIRGTMAKKTAKQAVNIAKKGKAAKVKPGKARRKADEKAAHAELPQWTPAEVDEAFRRFAAANPEPRGELHYVNPFTLLVAVVLSAQATDAGVNKATPDLFKLADTPEKMIKLGETKVRDLIKTIGLYRTKAKNVVALSQMLVEQHGGQVPHDRDALEALPGVGRKTANVVLNIAFGEPTIAVDTHIFRIGNRTGLAVGKTPLEVELKLLEVVPDRYRLHAHHWLILHGRYTCIARRPLCETCIIADLCKWPGKIAFSVLSRSAGEGREAGGAVAPGGDADVTRDCGSVSASVPDNQSDAPDVELTFPVEFYVEGVPVSLQTKNPKSLKAWKNIVSSEARKAVGGGRWATEIPVFATILYFPDAAMQGDIDNIVKPILDALEGPIYVEDRQVERVWVQKFEPDNPASFAEPTVILAAALDAGTPVVYIRIDDVNSKE
jgi:endonuclease III